MKLLSTLPVLLLVTVGCGPSDDDVRHVVRQELERASAITHVTNSDVIGPYSPAVLAGSLVFVSGQIALDPTTMQFAGDDIETQTRQALDNLMAVLSQAGCDSSDVVQCTVFLRNIDDYQKMNLIYGGYFADKQFPARMAVEVSDLPRHALVEISAIASKRPRP